MPRQFPACLASVLALAAVSTLLIEPAGAQYGTSATGGRGLPWENNRVRVRELSVEPAAPLPAGGDQVLVYLTADPDGRLPADAVWQAAGGATVNNRGPSRLDAIAIELKDAAGGSRGTPPETLDVQYGIDVSTVIDNPRVLVAKLRYGPLAYGGPLHFHAEDVIVVYLRGGYTYPGADFWGAVRVGRGDVDVIPANTMHRLANAGSDPLELLVIVPK